MEERGERKEFLGPIKKCTHSQGDLTVLNYHNFNEQRIYYGCGKNEIKLD